MADSPRIGAAAGAPAGDLLAIVPTLPVSAGAVYVAREDSASGWKASPQVETNIKFESSASFSAEIIPVRTIATWIAASRQSLDDVDGLADFIRARLLWALMRELEAQILSGSGAGENLAGLLPAAQNWVVPSGGWDLFGQLSHAAVQVRLNGYEPTAVVMHPRSALRVMLQRASDGQYIAQPPQIPRIVTCAAMAENQFLCGDFSQCVLRVRQDVTVDVSTEHSDFFTRNMIAIRAEQRVALVTYSGAAFVKGTLQTSPAS
jgi:HK97 family phage major capsid protein